MKAKIGVIADIHNNVYALEAVLQHFEQEHLDGIICCGDIIGTGAYPEETVRAVRAIPNMLACVCGNHDRFLTEGFSESMMSAEEAAYHRWEHSLLSKESKDFLAGLPRSQTLTILEHKIHVVHYGMDENGNYFRLPKTFMHDDDDLPALFENADADADIILFGHDHVRRTIHADRWYINPGSLGCPGKDRNIARAGILNFSENSFCFESVDIEYDVTKTLKDIEKFNFPAKDFIKKIFYGV